MTDTSECEKSEWDGNSNWKGSNLFKVKDQKRPFVVEAPDAKTLRPEIEPWLTALFQSEHLSLLVGSGISSAVHFLATGESGVGMEQMSFLAFPEQIKKGAAESAEKSGRSEPNFEDQIRVCNELIRGLRLYVLEDVNESSDITDQLKLLEFELALELKNLANSILENEKNTICSNRSEQAAEYLLSFLVSFASRSATRERLNVFTTNYDRIIEYGSEIAGLRLIDRFVGTVNPVFRSSRMEVDMHYNPPGIRGEPRYLEGVVQFTKLHGSLDWCDRNGVIQRYALPYGASDIATYMQDGCDRVLIYPNAAKDRETSEYPYVDLFRDFAAAVCRPNSTLVTYGYGFGDDHINRVIADMLTIPSAHLVVISFEDVGERAKAFYQRVKRPAQISLLIGSHFGDLKSLVDNYLPKPAIDRTTIRMTELIKSRGVDPQTSNLRADPDDRDQQGAEGEQA